MSSIHPKNQPASSISEHNRPRRAWYRRPLLIIPLVLLVLFSAGGGALAWRLNGSIATVQELTTPEPEISGETLGGDAEIVIDTGPAQEAVRAATEASEAPEQRGVTARVPAATDDSGGEADGAGARATEEPDAPVVAAQETVAPDTDDPMATRESMDAAADGSQAGVVIPTDARDASGDAMNVLLMGVDARPGEPIDVSVRPDALAVLHLNPETGDCRLLAIPRDTRVELPGYGQSKVNHALAIGGIPYQQLVVGDYLGIPIEHYGLIDFTGVVTVVDEIGGVTIEIPESFTGHGVSFEAGTQTLTGEERHSPTRAIVAERTAISAAFAANSKSSARCWMRCLVRTC